jgi:hypothetical protein
LAGPPSAKFQPPLLPLFWNEQRLDLLTEKKWNRRWPVTPVWV